MPLKIIKQKIQAARKGSLNFYLSDRISVFQLSLDELAVQTSDIAD